MIIDSHAHAWDQWPYDPPVPDARTRGLAENLLWEMDRTGVDKAVLVSACLAGNDTNNDYVADAVRRWPDRLIQFADVDSRWSAYYHRPGAAGRLAAIAERYDPRGVTHYLGPENDGWLTSSEGNEFFDEADRRSLIVSLSVPPCWQADLREVARARPRLKFICHHMASIPSQEQHRPSALEMVLPSAKLANIYIKASGFYYGEPKPYDYPHAPTMEIFRNLHATFGTARLVWGSDYPVAPLRGYTYRQSLEIVRDRCDFLSDHDKRRILGENLAMLLAPVGTPSS